MRTLTKLSTVLALVMPLAARAQISNSSHDLSSASTGPIHSSGTTTTDQTCKFCHTPHGAQTGERPIWSHSNSAYGATFSGTTTAGTNLVGTNNPSAASRHCLDCHDGTVAIGSVTIGGATTVYNMAYTTGGAAVTNLAGTIYDITGGTTGSGALNNNHPVGIPYAAQTGTYNGVTSAVAAAQIGAVGGFNALLTGCTTSTTGVCVGTAGGVGQYIAIALPATSGVAGDTAYGIECYTCHEPHGKYRVTPGYTYFLRASTTSSQICLACHNK